MKYVITGGAGNISKTLAEILLTKGHQVTLVGRHENHLRELVAQGASAAIGSLEDVAFLTKAFAGADAVYTMVPPNMAATNWKKWIGAIGDNYANAIQANGIRFVVNLSSAGAHLPEGCGPVSGLYLEEQALNSLKGVNTLHLRAGFFYTNLLGNIGMIKNMGIMGANAGGGDLKLVLVSPQDIAAVAADELTKLAFSGNSVQYVASDERTSSEIATAIGKAIGIPGLQWVLFSDADALNGMLQAGLPKEIASNFVEMNQSIQSGQMYEDYWANHPASLQKTKLEDFAETFSAIYNGPEAVLAH